MKDNSKNTKKQTKKKTIEPRIKDLAKEILKNADPTMEDGPKVMELEYDTSSGSIPEEPKEKEVIPIRTEFDRGTTRDTAFVIQKYTREIPQILEHYFGQGKRKFFIGNERTYSTIINHTRRRFRVISVEDQFGFKYTLWFDLTGIGNVGY